MKGAQRLFFPTDKEELEQETGDIRQEFKRRMEGERDRSRDQDEERDPVVTDRWADSMEDQVGENTTMIHQNRKLLGRLDERTAWIMRILIGLFISILASISVQVVVT